MFLPCLNLPVTPKVSNRRLPHSMHVLIGLLERDRKLIFIISMEGEAGRTLWREVDLNTLEWIILPHSPKVSFLMPYRGEEMTNVVFISYHIMFQFEDQLAVLVFKVLF